MTIRLMTVKRFSADRARVFARDEEGGMIIFSLYMLIAMLMIGGIAFDLMRYENLRTQLQNTTDAATLAAANLNNSQDPKFVVEDYFKKAIVSNFLKDVKVTPTTTSRTVSARAEARVQTTFMQWSGVDELELTTLGTARQDVGEIEIAMVLDMSGSMTSDGREGKLKIAAKKFIDTVYPTPLAPVDERPTISMIPYNDMVNLGPTFGPYFNVDTHHTSSWCVRLPDDVFSSVTWDDDLEIERIAHYDRITGSEDPTAYYAYNNLPTPQCPTDDTNAVLLHQNDPGTLKTYIDNLEADYWSWTAISLGAKFGVAMLDPSSNLLVKDMIAGKRHDGTTATVPPIGSYAADLPKPYFLPGIGSAGPPDTRVRNVKIMVLMTDGENTQQWDLKDGKDVEGELNLKSGESPVYFAEDLMTSPGTSSDPQAYAVHVADVTGLSFHEGLWYYKPGMTVPGFSTQQNFVWEAALGNMTPLEYLGGRPQRLSNPELYGSRTLSFIGAEIFGSQGWANGYISATDIYRSYETLDTQTDNICEAAQTAGIVIYAVAFEAPQDGKDLMKDCAYPAENYFEVSGDEVVVAFEAIARNINQLKLTQ